MFEVPVKLFLFPLQLSDALRQFLASQRDCSLSAIEYCNPPYLDLPFKMIEVSHKERSDCVSAFIKGVKHPGLNPTFKCFSFICPPAEEEEKQSEKILNAIAASAKHIINNISCDVQDRFLFSNDLLNGHLKRSQSHSANRNKPLPLVILCVCLFVSLILHVLGPRKGPLWRRVRLKEKNENGEKRRE